MQSSYSVNGSVFSSESMNTYITHVDSNAVLLANDSRWTYSSPSLELRNHYRYETSYYSSPDPNGYIHDFSSVVEYNRGIVPNQTVSWIPIKFVTDDGNVKMGFIKLKSKLNVGFLSVGVDCWGIQR